MQIIEIQIQIFEREAFLVYFSYEKNNPSKKYYIYYNRILYYIYQIIML
jgi:hypothetical protein